MKQALLSSFIVLVLIFSVSCSGSKSTVKGNTASNSPETQELLKKYKKEGFLAADKYCVIIVKPSDSSINITEITKKARNRAFSSIQKFIMSRGKRVLSTDIPKILNLVNDSGRLIKINDRSNSRIIYVYEIKKPNLLGVINQFGVN